MENEKHRALWDEAAKTDPAFTRKLTKPYPHTDIQSTYFFRKATELFGPCGIGWGFNLGEPIIRTDTATTGAGDTFKFTEYLLIRCDVWYKWAGERSEPVTAYGCKSVHTTPSGRDPYLDDEAVKKATTDGIKKALSMIGVCADVYMGQFDDPHYVDQRTREEAAKDNPHGFPAGMDQAALLPKGEHEGVALEDCPEHYLSRLAAEAKGVWQDAAKAELRRRFAAAGKEGD